MRSRQGFSLIELLIVLALATVVAAMVMPTVGRSLARMRLQRAASVLAADIQLAHSTAARQRQPVQIVFDAANRIVRLRSYPTTTTTFLERRYDATSDYSIQQLSASASSIVLYPNGLANAPVTVTLTTSGKTRVVSMTRAGQVRITP